MTVRNVKKNLAGQQDLLPGVGPYNQTRRGVAVVVDGPAKSYIELWKRSLQDSGFVYAGTFEDGCTVQPNECAVSLVAGKAYKWFGAANNIVPINGTPASTGGLGPAAWQEIGSYGVYQYIMDVLAKPTGAEKIGTPAGDLYDYFAAKGGVFPLTNVYPTMTSAQINAILSAGGSVYFNEGNYIVANTSQTLVLNQNLRVMAHPRAVLKAGGDGVTVLRGSSADIGTTIRNTKLYSLRIDLNGYKNCTGFHGFDIRNNSCIEDMWIDMRLGANCTGLLIEHFSYGMNLDSIEILNGGVGSVRRKLRNGPNAITLKDHQGYSADPNGPLPDYDTVIFNGMDGAFNFPVGGDLWPTAAVNIVGGFFQNTAKYGLLESGVSTNVVGAYFERNAISDVVLAAGSYYFTSNATHHSLDIGESCYRIAGANHYNIGPFNPATRSIGQFNAISGNGKADGSKFWGATLDSNIGVVDGVILDLGANSIKQYAAATLPIKIREGFRGYRMNVTNGLNITVTGSPYDGQQINMMVRGSNIASLSFSGTPVDVTGANTATTKTAQFTATWWASIGKWTLSMPQWTASP